MKEAKQPEFIRKKNGRWYYIGDSDLEDKDVNSIIWPDNLEIYGWLNLSGSNIKNLPDNLTVKGDLYLEGCKEITSLPKNLKCNSLDIRDTKIKEIKNDVEVESVLCITSISDIKIEEGFFCEVICIRGEKINHLNKKIFDSLPRSLTRYFHHYNSSINNNSIKTYYFEIYAKKVKRRLIRKLEIQSYRFYRFFRVESKEELIRALYGKS